MMKSAFFLAFSLFTFQAWAAGPTILSASGASEIVLTGTPTIYGGLGGADCSAGNTTSTCNSCLLSLMTCPYAAQGLCACNTARIHDNLTVTISVKRPDNTVGPLRVIVKDTVINPGAATTGDSVPLTWGQICQAADGGGTCDSILTNKTIPAKIFVDVNSDNSPNGEQTSDFNFRILRPEGDFFHIFGLGTSEGIGAFVPYPGDEKVYIKHPDTTSNFPNLSYGSKAVKVRVFHSETGLQDTHVEAPSSDIKVVEGGNELERNVVTGLTNNKTYVFRVALVDEANNVVQFFPAPGADAACETPATSPFPGCTFAATPEQVLGLLGDDINCFIATAAYGSALEPKLDVFRDFRFEILLRNPLGRKFVNAYYKYGPYAAQVIHDKPILRALTRAALWPAYIFSATALKIGFLPTFFISIMLLPTLMYALWFGLRRGV